LRAIQQVKWSPDGAWLAFTIGSYSDSSGGSVYVMRPDDAERRRLTAKLPDCCGDLSWSPASTSLAFVQGDVDYQHSRIELVDVGSRKLRVLPRDRRLLDLQWSPSGNALAFTLSTGSGPSAVYTIGVSGRNLRRLARPTGRDESVRGWG
jgi:Tol biopolymer transport system component